MGRNDILADARNLFFGCLFVALGLLFLALLGSGSLLGAAVVVLTLTVAIVVHMRSPAQRAARLVRRAEENAAGDPALAIRRLEEAHAVLPDRFDLLRRAAAIASGADDFERAADLYEWILEAGGATWLDHLLLGQAAYRNGDHDRAIEVLRPIPSTWEQHPAAVALMGGLFMARGDLESAVKALMEAPLWKRELGEPLKEIHYLLGRCYEELGDAEAATRHFRRVHAADTGYRDVADRIAP